MSGIAGVGRSISGLAGAAILAALILGPVTPQLRFADKLRPYAEGIFGQAGPIDIVFIGTSRVRSSVMGNELEALLEERLNRPVVIYDLGKSARGADADYLLLKETINRSPVKLVVAEYTPARQANNHFFFVQAATWGDLFKNVSLLENPASRLALLIRSKLAVFMTELTAGRWFWPPEHVKPASTFDFTTPRGPNEARIWRAISTGRRPMDSPPLGDSGNIVQDTYVRRTIELVKSQGGDVVLITIPGLDQQALASADRERLAAYFGVDVIGLDEGDLRNFSPHHYSDEKHHGWLAVNLYTPLLAQWLAPRLADRESRQPTS